MHALQSLPRGRTLLLRPIAAIALAALAMSGCVYTNIKAPLDTDVASTTLGNKVGTAHNESVLWLVAWGDAGSATAAKNGGIKPIDPCDQVVFPSLFGLYTKTTTIVYGD